MDEELKEKLYDAKIGLMDLADDDMMKGISVNNQLVKRRIIFALEAIDDALEGKVRFPTKNYDVKD